MTRSTMMNTNLEAQRRRLLSILCQHSVTTLQCRDEFSILHPAARIMELKRQGHNIITHRTTEIDRNGRPHRVARYVLSSKKAGGVNNV